MSDLSEIKAVDFYSVGRVFDFSESANVFSLVGSVSEDVAIYLASEAGISAEEMPEEDQLIIISNDRNKVVGLLNKINTDVDGYFLVRMAIDK